MKQAGLTQIKEILDTKDPGVPLSSLPHMDTQSLTNSMSKFDSFLVLISADVSPQLEKLSSSQQCQQVQSKAIQLLLDTYRQISQAVEDPENNYENPNLIMPRTVEDMEAIFSFAL